MDGISLTSLTTRSPDGDNNIEFDIEFNDIQCASPILLKTINLLH